jgi:RNA polymerase sigma-70 factor (ECF subfamily)
VGGGVAGDNNVARAIEQGGGELWRMVSALPPKQRSAVVLRYAADMSYRGIGEMLDSSEDAARRNVHEGLQKLRGELR